MTSLLTSPSAPPQVAGASPFDSSAAALRRSHPDFTLSGAFFIGPQGEVAHIDAAGLRLLGCGPAGWGGAWATQLEPNLTTAGWAERRQALYAGPVRFTCELMREDGLPLDVEMLATLQQIGGRSYVLQLARNASLAPRLQRQLVEITRRHELIGLAANDGLWVWDLVSGEVDYSPRWAALIGLPEARLSGSLSLWLDRVHPADRALVDAALSAHLDGETAVFQLEHRLEHRLGSWKWVQVRGLVERDSAGTLTLMAASTSDITHRRNADERLRYEAFHDPLTGLANRAWLIHRLQDALRVSRASLEAPHAHPEAADPAEATASRAPTPRAASHFALLQIGVDRFKLINDSLGLSLGDMLLRAVAARIARSVRSSDTVARIGGDEFAVLLQDLESPSQVSQVADRIAQDLAAPFDLRGYAVYSSASMGIVPTCADYLEPEELLRDANSALVQAKRGGRSRRVAFDSSMRQANVRRLMMETELRRALARAELKLAYQPIIAIASRRLLGFEALCRWNHAKRGEIGPSEFIPMAEESGLIMPIGRWVLTRACEETVRWNQAHGEGDPLWVAVNVSGRQLSQPGFLDEVRLALEQSGLPPALLHLELTESVLMENAEESRAILDRLRGLGVRLSIDDFGTGYSSLAYLRRFPIETLKIDRSFLTRGAETEDSWAIIQTILSLAQALGLFVVVEGVESDEHLTRLRQLGCQAAQGYLISRPLEEHLVPRFLHQLEDGLVTFAPSQETPPTAAEPA